MDSLEASHCTRKTETHSEVVVYQYNLCRTDHNELHVVLLCLWLSDYSVIDKLGCGDFSFPTRLSRRYAGGYCSGVIAISFLFLCDLNGKLVNPMNAIKRASHLFCSRLLTVCPLVMVQQAGYDHLRILCDPFFPSSIPLFFVTGLATGVWAQFLFQPFITLLTPSNSLITKRCSISSLYKSFPKNAFHVLCL